MIVLLLACTPEGGDGRAPPVDTGTPPDPIGVLSGPTLSDGIDTPLARRLALETEVPTTLTLTLSSDDETLEVVFPGLSATHDVPVLGFEPDQDWTVGIRITADDGRSTVLPPIPVHTDPLPADFPILEGLAFDADRSAGGYWLVPLEVPNALAFWLVAIDPSDHEVAWLYDGPTNWGDVRMTESGTILGLAGGAVEMDLNGRPVRSWRRQLTGAENEVLIPWSLDHELFPMPDGSFFSLTATSLDVPRYPTSYEDPDPTAEARIVDSRVLRFAADGSPISSWPLSARLDTARIGFNSLQLTSGGYDWVHTNAVIPDGDGVIVSLRHQDSLIRLGSDGALDWILGDPAGWDRTFTGSLLTATAGTRWPYHQHGPAFDDDGWLWVFDNRTVEATPYAAVPPLAGASRVVAYTVDGAARTVTQVAEWSPPTELRSGALGNVAPIAGSGHVLVDFGMLLAEGDTPDADLGWGAHHTRIMEVDPAETEPVADLRIRTDPAVTPEGMNVYRAVPIPSLYPPGVTVTRR